MGSINFLTSDVVTLVFKPIDADDMKTQILENIDCFEGLTADDINYDFCMDEINDEYGIVWDESNYILKGFDFNYYQVEIKSGYYESLQVVIKSGNYCYFDDTQERRDVQKELTQLKNCLIELVNQFNFCVCFPSWCTTYLDYAGTIKAIKDAIKAERANLQNIPTWKVYNKKKG